MSRRSWSACVLLALAAFAGCDSNAGNVAGAGKKPGAPSARPANSAGGDLRRIILLTNGNSPFWDTGAAGLQAAEKELGLHEAGLAAVVEVNDGTPQGQIDKLRQFGSQADVAAIGVSVIDAANAAIADEMRKLQDQGIQVVTIDSDVEREAFRDARFAFIGTDNLVAGRELGTALAHLLPKGGEYVTFVGRTGAQNAIERVDGVAQGAGGKFKSLDNMGDDIDRDRAQENVRNAIINHPKLKALVGIWSYNAPAIVHVAKELDRRKDFTIAVFDAEPVAIKDMDEGNVDVMVVQNPFQMGYQGVRLMKALIEKDDLTIKEMLPNRGDAEGDLVDTGLKVVVPDGATPLAAGQFGAKTEFLKLSEFKEWLAKYGLEGS
ncbi:MAG TPA: substrate-binding domain-containing protein [Pirellulales bacterium]|nr:substrate-binding domain-containing protein [Pirellulales bacterium]